MMAQGKYYVAVTGLLNKNWRSKPKFFYNLSRAYNDAVKSNGNVYASMFSKEGIYLTITVWVSPEQVFYFISMIHSTFNILTIIFDHTRICCRKLRMWYESPLSVEVMLELFMVWKMSVMQRSMGTFHRTYHHPMISSMSGDQKDKEFTESP